MSANFTALAYLIASVFFIMSLRGLSSAKTSRSGNLFGMAGMAIAIVVTVMLPQVQSYLLISICVAVGGAIGIIIARQIQMTALPQLFAAFHSLVGLAAVGVAAAALNNPESYGIGYVGSIYTTSLIEMSLGVAIGAITFTGSIIAFAKLQGIIGGKPLVFSFQHHLNALLGMLVVFFIVLLALGESHIAFWIIVVLSFLLGFLLILPIGGADMPVIISMLNSYSGWAAASIGFTLNNNLLIIVGALVGSSGAILSYIMCKGMNRSFFSVILGGFGGEATAPAVGEINQRLVKSGNAEDAAFLLENAQAVIIVPGYGMAVAQAQHALREMADLLKEKGIKIKFAIHPVAGRMPGHMNVLLAEANVPYEDVFELEDINRDFSSADVAFVIGANDVTNPIAKSDPLSPLYGMPILDVEVAKTTLFVKRSLSSGYAGVDNDLFYRDSTMMLFGDAKKMTEDIVKALT
jgi:NAD(P) transhydrogenase subunit beta